MNSHEQQFIPEQYVSKLTKTRTDSNKKIRKKLQKHDGILRQLVLHYFF